MTVITRLFQYIEGIPSLQREAEQAGCPHWSLYAHSRLGSLPFISGRTSFHEKLFDNRSSALSGPVMRTSCDSHPTKKPHRSIKVTEKSIFYFPLPPNNVCWRTFKNSDPPRPHLAIFFQLGRKSPLGCFFFSFFFFNLMCLRVENPEPKRTTLL